MNPTVCTHKNNPNFWIFGLFFFLYFFIMATCFPFLPIWLSDVIGLNKTETGLVFSSLSLFAICFQPILGVISDKLGLKKPLMWIVTVLLVLIAPFFLYVFAPLLKTNIWLGALSGGAYIGFAFSAGAGAMEAYIERVSRNSGFEYGKARTFGCLGWALCATTAGMLFSINPEWVFWMGSAAALLLVVLKALFAFLTRGATAGFLSLCGGGLSLVVMLVLLHLPISGYIFCAGAALAHNLGQLAGAAVLLSSAMALGYAPVLLAAGLAVGGISCLLSRALFAALPASAGEQRQGSPFKK